MLAPLLALTALTAATAPATDETIVALVVGNNLPLPGSGYPPLQYADDDALRFATYFEELGAQVFTTTSVDFDTAQRYPALADRVAVPTRAHVLEQIAGARAALAAAEGPRVLFVYFSGHGSVTSSDAYLHLVDGRFSRTDLHEQILRNMPAERVHVIIDSCHAYFLVNARGERVAVAQDEESLDRYPHAGFLLSTSRGKEVQEWSGYQAGVFSYQVLGALRGAADVDGDRRVSYAEAHGYVVAANLGVKNPSARIQPYVREPIVRGDTLLDLRPLPDVRRVRVPEAIAGHFVVSDAAGTRVLDAHKPVDATLELVSPPDAALFLTTGEDVYDTRADDDGRLVFEGPLTERPAVLASKGSIADEFRDHLFVHPLTVDFVRGLDAAHDALRPTAIRRSAPPWERDPITLGLLGAAAAGAITGVVATGYYVRDRQRFERRPVTPEHEAFRSDAERARAVLIGGFVAGASFLTAGIIRAVFTNGPAWAVAPTTNGAIVSGAFP